MKDDPTPANYRTMERLKKPSVWKRVVDKLGLSIPVVMMMVKYVVPEWACLLDTKPYPFIPPSCAAI